MTDHAMMDSNGNLLPGAQINNGCDGTGNKRINSVEE
jgi:hypothetical protein